MLQASCVPAVMNLRWWNSWAAVAAMLFASFTGTALAQVVVPSVPGTSNPYLSGMPNGSTCCSGDSAPAHSPVQVTGLTLTPGASLTFSATGGVDFGGGVPTSGPDGGSSFSTVSTNGISGGTWPVNALVPRMPM